MGIQEKLNVALDFCRKGIAIQNEKIKRARRKKDNNLLHYCDMKNVYETIFTILSNTCDSEVIVDIESENNDKYQIIIPNKNANMEMHVKNIVDNYCCNIKNYNIKYLINKAENDVAELHKWLDDKIRDYELSQSLIGDENIIDYKSGFLYWLTNIVFDDELKIKNAYSYICKNKSFEIMNAKSLMIYSDYTDGEKIACIATVNTQDEKTDLITEAYNMSSINNMMSIAKLIQEDYPELNIITEYSERIENAFLTESGLLDETLLKQLTPSLIESLKIDSISDMQTMCLYIPLSKEIQQKFRAWVKMQKLFEKPDISAVWCEYWIDEDSYHYAFFGNQEIYSATEDFSCNYLNSLIKAKYIKAYCRNN